MLGIHTGRLPSLRNLDEEKSHFNTSISTPQLVSLYLYCTAVGFEDGNISLRVTDVSARVDSCLSDSCLGNRYH